MYIIQVNTHVIEVFVSLTTQERNIIYNGYKTVQVSQYISFYRG